MSEEMNNELEEVIIVTATDDDGNEVNYREKYRFELDGKVFALLVEVPDRDDDADFDDDGDADFDDDGDEILARVDMEDGEEVYVAPTDEEFEAANAELDRIFSEE
ncbi:DUF1292 domain-containing protein [uncultured Megasphaera sp.]|uniref:DUF1292 domain-containing protein n=1 Tax=Megasphaera massiliensis TaxID=1232428 RepID=UPI00266D6DD9|nr:DUF1292 domain-containing protein [uncultured Megasphaera sp.]